MPKGLTEKLTGTPEGMRLYQQERAILEVTELICQLMQEQGVTRAELAKRLGRTKGHVSQLLDGGRNMTIQTVSDLLVALGHAIHFQEGPLQATISSCPMLSYVDLASWGEHSGSWPENVGVRLDHTPCEPARKMAV